MSEYDRLKQQKEKMLREQRSALEMERDELKERLADWENDVKAAMDERCDLYEKHCTCVPALRREVKRLQEALGKFGVHPKDCRVWHGAERCSCGLSKLLGPKGVWAPKEAPDV